MPLLRKRDMNQVLEVDRLRQLIALGPALVSELDLDVLLNRLLETACSVTAARYAAIGVLDKERRELERFITLGVSEEQERVIGERPRGRGVLGVLINDPRPLRLTNVTAHPHSSGFPKGHPPMHSFLGVPVMIRGTAWGNLYLTEKRIGEFTEADEYAATTLATWAAIAVDHSRLLAGTSEGEEEPAEAQPAEAPWAASPVAASEPAAGEPAAGETAESQPAVGQASADARGHIDALYRAGVIQSGERDEIARRLS